MRFVSFGQMTASMALANRWAMARPFLLALSHQNVTLDLGATMLAHSAVSGTRPRLRARHRSGFGAGSAAAVALALPFGAVGAGTWPGGAKSGASSAWVLGASVGKRAAAWAISEVVPWPPG